MASALLVVLIWTALGPQQPQPLPRHPVAALAAAIDLTSRELRAEAAQQLAQREVALETWLAAARALRPRDIPATVERLDAQTIRHRTELHITGASRSAEILVRMPRATSPSQTSPAPMPLLLVRHAAGGNGETALQTWRELADRCGLVLAAPTESYELYRLEGWPHIADGREALLAALRFVRRHYDIDEQRVFLAGERAGGHMVWDIGLHYPDQFAGLLPCNGSPRLGNANYENNTLFLESSRKLPLRALQWGAQEALQVENVQRAIEQLRGFGHTQVERCELRDQQQALGEQGVPAAWFEQRRQWPERVVRLPDLAQGPNAIDMGRAYWIEVLRVDPDLKLPFPPTMSATSLRGLDERGRRALFEQRLREQHPRLEVTHRGGGRFDVEDRHVHAFRLLLTDTMRGVDGKVQVHWRGHVLEKTAAPSVLVLLREFVERFDKSFLPTAEVHLP